MKTSVHITVYNVYDTPQTSVRITVYNVYDTPQDLCTYYSV